MGKKMKLPFPFKTKESQSIPSWPWPSCTNPRTLSFRHAAADTSPPPESCFTPSSDSRTFYSSDSRSFSSSAEPIESVIRGMRSDRLFFDPGETNSILEEGKREGSGSSGSSGSSGLGLKESVAMSMESVDPFGDFKESMEEMVEAHGLSKDWDGLEELLSSYLRVNGKSNHGYIVAAFVDLLVGLTFVSNHSISSSPLSSSSSISSTTCPSSSSPSLSEETIAKSVHTFSSNVSSIFPLP